MLHLFATNFCICYAAVKQRFAELRKELKLVDEEDKSLDRKRRKERRMKEKMKWKRGREEENTEIGSDDDLPASDREESGHRINKNKKAKIYFDSDSDDGETTAKDKKGVETDSISMAEQEHLALKLLESMHS